ncbi:unnamed protein product, partial [Symbiodinium sp. CCMP2456]
VEEGRDGSTLLDWWRPSSLEWSFTSLNLLDKLAKSIPLKGWVAGALNKITLKLSLHPTFALEFLMEIQKLIMDGAFQMHLRERIIFRARWTASNGFSRDVERQETPDTPVFDVQMPRRIEIPLLFGVSPCFGLPAKDSTEEYRSGGLELTMWSSRKKITSIEGCPEFRLGATFAHDFSQTPAAEAFFDPQDDPDRRLCVRNLRFETDGNADVGRDEPYLRVCIAGKCKSTSYEYFGNADCPCGNDKCGFGAQTYRWCYVSSSCPVAEEHRGSHWTRCIYPATYQEELCFDVRGTWLETQGLLFSSYDSDTYFDDPYVAPLEIKVDDLVNYGSRTYWRLPMEALLGTQAYLTFTARVQRMRRLSNDDSQGDSQIGHAPIEEMQEPGPRRTSSRCNAGQVDVALGLHGYFGGLFIPYSWSGKNKGLKLVNERDFESQVFYGPE